MDPQNLLVPFEEVSAYEIHKAFISGDTILSVACHGKLISKHGKVVIDKAA